MLKDQNPTYTSIRLDNKPNILAACSYIDSRCKTFCESYIIKLKIATTTSDRPISITLHKMELSFGCRFTMSLNE